MRQAASKKIQRQRQTQRQIQRQIQEQPTDLKHIKQKHISGTSPIAT